MQTKPTTILLRERFSWMGNHSGYDQVCNSINAIEPELAKSVWKEAKPVPQIFAHLLKQVVQTPQSSPLYNLQSTIAELKVQWTGWRHNSQLIHITYIENLLGLLAQSTTHSDYKIIGTCHQPPSWWRLKHPYPSSISALDALIVLSRQEVSYFEEFIGPKVHFIPHGIDTEFFRPAITPVEPSINAPRCVFSGTWLRDLDTLSQIIDTVLDKNPNIQFDIIIPRTKRKHVQLYRIARHSQVTWHSGLSDQELLQVYQNAHLLLLPLLDCTANNALLEAIACGLPVISNQVGGISDYTDPSFADLFPIGDVNGMVASVLELTEDIKKRTVRGDAARKFAVENLQWKIIAKRTIELYYSLLSSN